MSDKKTWHNPDDQTLKSILRHAKTIAVVGCSPKPERTSHQITAFLIEQGYEVFPIHPQADVILGRKVYSSLADVPVPIDIVNVFRKPEFTAQIAEQAVAIQAKTLWLQQGIYHEQAYTIATSHGINCVMDLCIAVMHRLLLSKS